MAAKLLRNMLIGDVTGRHLNVRNRRRLSPPPPARHGLGCRVGGGGGGRRMTVQTKKRAKTSN